MTAKAYLVLQDGTLYEGEGFGANSTVCGEVVFDTAMAGYQEMLTDPASAGQLLLLTYPLVGNYGINAQDNESSHVQARGLIVREHCLNPSHYQCVETLDDYLKRHGIPGIAGLDTRALTRKLRTSGAMTGLLTSTMEPEEALIALQRMPHYADQALAQEVGADIETTAQAPGSTDSMHVVVIDCGVRHSTIKHLVDAGCHVTMVPSATTSRRILELAPDGVLLSSGPGDPTHLSQLEATTRDLLGIIPVMGISLGQLVIARTLGASTFKLKFGHHGGNHPVKDLSTGRIYITTQNHGYAVAADALPDGLQVSHVNLNDGTVEGLRHRDLPLLSIQFHAEGAPGPRDTVYLFDDFVRLMRAT